MSSNIPVLDRGYVRLVDFMGDDLAPTNAARVSYDKESEDLEERDKRLLNFLAKNDHTSPFRHAFVTFEVYAPLMVARQWWKYCIGSEHQDKFLAWNESSRRYVTEVPEFYHPDEWREAPDNSKQGSGGPIGNGLKAQLDNDLRSYYSRGEELYERYMSQGLCAEQARLFLPAYGLYVRWRWSSSMQGVFHFLQQRLAHDSQKEIQLFAEAVKEHVDTIWPHSWEAWSKR